MFLFLFAVVGISVAEEMKREIPQPQVDERVELLGIVYRLAGASEYQCDSFKEYDDAINRHFAPFKNHPVVLVAKVSRSTTGIGYNAVVDYAIHLSIENGRVIFPGEDSEITLEKLEPRWNRQTARHFAKQLDDFYVKSRFHEFFESHREVYQKIEQQIKTINDKIDYAWYKRFYGDANLEHFHVILNCTSENNGYGARCRFRDGHEEFFAILGVNGPEAVYREDGFIAWTIHEFNHSFCNPLVEKHLDDLKPAAERVWPFVGGMMTRQAYPEPKFMLNEYLVRACEIHYLRHHGNKNEADLRLQHYRSLGFLWIEELVALLDRYEKERDKYPTLDDFMPEIVNMQNALVTDEYISRLQKREEDRPKITALNPPNGAKDVDPGITEISVTFDRPMNGGMSWCSKDGHATFPTRKPVPAIWSDDRLTCTLGEITLEPGKTYNIWLNTDTIDDFRSTDNIPLKPVHYTFTTRAEATETKEIE
ncbi:MAG: DUF4932 domain-containing protein [Planctomycetaceae bacterium]|nr:DUF4932 domain-containing protein [Planctomycetaceae bacterium]